MAAPSLPPWQGAGTPASPSLGLPVSLDTGRCRDTSDLGTEKQPFEDGCSQCRSAVGCLPQASGGRFWSSGARGRGSLATGAAALASELTEFLRSLF